MFIMVNNEKVAELDGVVCAHLAETVLEETSTIDLTQCTLMNVHLYLYL